MLIRLGVLNGAVGHLIFLAPDNRNPECNGTLAISRAACVEDRGTARMPFAGSP